MSLTTQTQTLYVARPRELDDWNGELPEEVEFKTILQSDEIATVRNGSMLVSTGESLDDYRKRLKEGRVWRAS